MLPPVLSEEEIQANLKRKDYARDFVQVCLQTKGCEPSDTEVLKHLNLLNRLGVSMYDWVDTKVVSTSSKLRTEATLSNGDVVFGDPSEWLVLPMSEDKRI